MHLKKSRNSSCSIDFSDHTKLDEQDALDERKDLEVRKSEIIESLFRGALF